MNVAESAKPARLQMWAIVELMGHQCMAGEITEVTVAGHGFVRIDVPATTKVPAFTRMVSPSSIYAINPTTEDLARRAAEAFQPRPVQEWELPKALPPAGALEHLGTHNPDGTFTAADDVGCAVCRRSDVPLKEGPDSLPRCRACGGDGA